MKGKIALEEHFAIPETLQDSAIFVPGEFLAELSARIMDIQDRRLREMDAHGIEMMILSLNAPAVQAIPDFKTAIFLRSPCERPIKVCMRPCRGIGIPRVRAT